MCDGTRWVRVTGQTCGVCDETMLWYVCDGTRWGCVGQDKVGSCVTHLGGVWNRTRRGCVCD